VGERICQRVYQPNIDEGDFAVVESSDPERMIAGARLCGKPAFYKQVSPDGAVTIWICTDCFNEFEAEYGEGAWADTAEFPDEEE
jgi:hypothetical protein